jgi:hypothetical protein
MHSLRAAVTIVFAAAAFILPTVATATASTATTVSASATPDDSPWN